MTGPTDGERAVRVRLMLAAEPGNATLLRLVEEFGPEAVVARLTSGRAVGAGLDPVAARLAAGVDEEGQWSRAGQCGARFVCPGDASWPESLDVLAHVTDDDGNGGLPLGLWVRGSLPEPGTPAVGVVGSRAATDYGGYVAAELGGDLAAAGVVVVSGGAYGIDGDAHRGALSVHGQTIAVLACGADVAYPPRHEGLLERIVASGHGAVVSEAPLGAIARRNRFLVRNRLIAAMGVGTVVVEAAARSGALNTANWADRCSLPVFVIPGPVTSDLSRGAHRLIRERGAVLVTGAEDVLGDLGLDAGADEAAVPLPLPPAAVPAVVLAAVGSRGGATAEELATATGMPVADVLAAVGELALLGHVEMSGPRYRLTAGGRAAQAAAAGSA